MDSTYTTSSPVPTQKDTTTVSIPSLRTRRPDNLFKDKDLQNLTQQLLDALKQQPAVKGDSPFVVQLSMESLRDDTQYRIKVQNICQAIGTKSKLLLKNKEDLRCATFLFCEREHAPKGYEHLIRDSPAHVHYFVQALSVEGAVKCMKTHDDQINHLLRHAVRTVRKIKHTDSTIIVCVPLDKKQWVFLHMDIVDGMIKVRGF